MSTIEKILELDRRILWVIYIIIAFGLNLYPVGLPVPTYEWVEDFYDTIDNLEPGDYVHVTWSLDPSIMDALVGSGTAMKHLMRKEGVKVIHWCQRPEGIPIMNEIIEKANPSRYNKVYGEDWVNLGFIAGGETALAAMGSNLKGISTQDFYGNDLNTLPAWTELDGDWSKVVLLVSFGYKEATDDVRRQLQTNYGIPIVQVGSAQHFHAQYHFYATGSIIGMLFGQTDNAAYDILVGISSRASIATDVLSGVHIMIMFYIIVANIAYFLSGKRTKMSGEGIR
jgi:hypothetical protein